MKQYHVIGVSVLAVFIIFIASFSNVVGYQTVQLSNQKQIQDKNYQKELLFQTILDIINIKEIQKIIINSQIYKRSFFNPSLRFSASNNPIFTKTHLKNLFYIGLMFSKTFNKLKIHSILEQYQFYNQEIHKKITAVIEKDNIINGKIRQLSDLGCDCENTNSWNFPILCTFLYQLWVSLVYLVEVGGTIICLLLVPIFYILNFLVNEFDCYWLKPF